MGQFCSKCEYDQKLVLSQGKKSHTIRNNKKSRNLGIKASMLESETVPNPVPFPTQSELRSSDYLDHNSEMQCSDFDMRSGAQDRRLMVSMLKNSEISNDLSAKGVKFDESALARNKQYNQSEIMLSDKLLDQQYLSIEGKSQFTTGANSPYHIIENKNLIFDETMMFNPIRQKMDQLMKKQMSKLDLIGHVDKGKEKKQTLLQKEFYQALIPKMEVLHQVQDIVWNEFNLRHEEREEPQQEEDENDKNPQDVNIGVDDK